MEVYEKKVTRIDSRSQGRGADYFNHDLKELRRLLPWPGRAVLDVGAGTGRVSAYLALHSERVTGVDVSEPMLRVVQRKSFSKNIFFAQMDGESLAFRPESFDVVTLMGTFEFVADPTQFFQEAHRVLRPNGVLVFNCYNQNRLVSLRRYGAEHSLGVLRDCLARQGFRIRTFRSYHPFHDALSGLASMVPKESIYRLTASLLEYLEPGTSVISHLKARGAILLVVAAKIS
jgi:ubiquinone/menaquinone biosynthesis C-methylase UbiE